MFIFWGGSTPSSIYSCHFHLCLLHAFDCLVASSAEALHEKCWFSWMSMMFFLPSICRFSQFQWTVLVKKRSCLYSELCDVGPMHFLVKASASFIVPLSFECTSVRAGTTRWTISQWYFSLIFCLPSKWGFEKIYYGYLWYWIFFRIDILHWVKSMLLKNGEYPHCTFVNAQSDKKTQLFPISANFGSGYVSDF